MFSYDFELFASLVALCIILIIWVIFLDISFTKTNTQLSFTREIKDALALELEEVQTQLKKTEATANNLSRVLHHINADLIESDSTIKALKEKIALLEAGAATHRATIETMTGSKKE